MADIRDWVRATNSRTTAIGSATITTPKIALATSWATLQITSGGANSLWEINDGIYNIKAYTNSSGKVTISLEPFIRLACANLRNRPFNAGTGTQAVNRWRGTLSLYVYNRSNGDGSIDVPYIFGGSNPVVEVYERYIDYIANPAIPTWATLEKSSVYDSNGNITSQDWSSCDFNLNRLYPNITGDTNIVVPSAMFARGSIVFGDVIYHVRYDCRVKDVVGVRWIDNEGRINTRQLGISGESRGGNTESSYTRHRWNREGEYIDGMWYWRGSDRWANRANARTITLGEDVVPIGQYSWLCSLLQSPCVEVCGIEDGNRFNTWARCNVVDGTCDIDPRKETFAFSITLEAPNDYVAQTF